MIKICNDTNNHDNNKNTYRQIVIHSDSLNDEIKHVKERGGPGLLSVSFCEARTASRDGTVLNHGEGWCT